MPTTYPSRRRIARAASLLLLGPVFYAACSSSPTVPDDTTDGVEEAYDHALAAGASAADLLSGADFDRLVVEISYVQGQRPTDEGLQALADFLSARLNKPGGIELRISAELPVASQATYSIAEIRALEKAHRTAYTEGRTLAIHMLFVGGEYADQANVLGIAYNNTSMVIFEQKIRDNTGGVTQPSTSTVEGTVARHEVGHLLGLVNVGSAMQAEHQDEPNGHHCDDPDCLMYYAVRTSDFISNLLGGVPTLDQDCLDDLQANGGR